MGRIETPGVNEKHFWNMPDKKKTWVFHRHSLPSVFSQPGSSCVPVYSHLTLVGWSSPLDYHCSFPLPRLGTRFCHRQDGSGTAGARDSAWQHRIWFSGSGRIPWRRRHLGCWPCCSSSPVSCEKNKKRSCLFPCYMVARKHGGSLKQTECRCLWCGKKGCGKKRSKQMKGWGDNKLFASQATMSAIALLEWMQQARVFQPDYWSMWTHIFPAMGEETVMTKPMPLPLFSCLLLSLPAPRLCLCLILSSFLSCLCLLPVCLFLSFSLYITQGDIIFPLFKMERKASGWYAVRACCQKLGTFATFQGNPNWKPWLWRCNK